MRHKEYRNEIKFWIRRSQKKAFGNEIACLREGKSIDKNSALRDYDPIWDEKEEILRVGGRLSQADLPFETKHPIILPKHDAFVEKLVHHYHRANCHTGPAQTLSDLRVRYCIVGGQREVRRILHTCLDCRKLKQLQQKMAPLPKERIDGTTPAFTYIGIDFAGPVFIKQNDDEDTKGYICIFTCATSRAVHLELCEDMSTGSFLRALERMINRKGCPTVIYSDNAKTFKASCKILKGLFDSKQKKNQIEQKLVENEIEWKFITERAPWQGGFYERMVQSVKIPLRKILKNTRMNNVECSCVHEPC